MAIKIHNSQEAFDYAAALYWYASDHHGGQGSKLYSILSRVDYKPGLRERSVDHVGSEEANEIYNELESGEISSEEVFESLERFQAFLKSDDEKHPVENPNDDDDDDDSDDDEEEGDDEPDEDSITTKDDRKWYQYGKLYFTGSREDLFEKMDDDKFWPDVFVISDHGNAIRVEREGEEE